VAECPFCGEDIDEDIVVFGGNCPKCFVSILGEEAPTDPGEEVKAAIAREDERRSSRRALIPVLVVTPVLLALAGVALWFAVLRPEPEFAVLDFDAMEEFPAIELHGIDSEAVADEQDALTHRNTRNGVAQSPDAESGGDRSEQLRRLEKMGQGAEQVVQNAQTGGPLSAEDRTGAGDLGGSRKSSAGQPSGQGVAVEAGSAPPSPTRKSGFGVSVTQTRKAGELTDAESITKMISKRMSAQSPQLNQCYERALKQNEALAGRWRVTYTVTKAGGAADVGASAMGTPEADFEACLVKVVSKWRFDRIVKDQPVKRSFRFTRK
jgi:hypothetical protein